MTRRYVHRFRVEIDCHITGLWDEVGSVILYEGAPNHEVEHALAPLGVYAPRGADHVVWHAAVHDRDCAIVFDASGNPIVRLFPVDGWHHGLVQREGKP